MKRVEELEKVINDLKNELSAKNALIKENELFIKKKDEIISMKDSIIKEKDNYIKKLESEVVAFKSKENLKVSNGILADSTNYNNNSGGGGGGSNEFYNSSVPNNALLSVQNKTKRIAISAEPAQNRFNKTKEMRNILKKFHKTDE
jgi:hypothetical protein